VPEKTGTIYIKWVRSGTGFPRRQREAVRSIGLRRLNQVVERLDTASMRGLVAKVCHLVEVVERPVSPAWASVPEYKIIPSEALPKSVPPAEKAGKKAPAEAPAASMDAEAVASPPRKEAAAAGSEKAAPQKKSGATKSRASESAKKQVSAGSEKPASRRKAKEPKSAAKEESKPKKGKK